jgi:hypothetical protein
MPVRTEILWHIKPGDLVKIKYPNPKYPNPPGWNPEKTIYGIVLEKYDSTQQIQLFPEVSVYVLSTHEIRAFGPGSLEIISNS